MPKKPDSDAGQEADHDQPNRVLAAEPNVRVAGAAAAHEHEDSDD